MNKGFVPSHSNPSPEQMGDPWAACAKHVLSISSLYSGDDTSIGEVYHQDQFIIYHVSKMNHVISDNTWGTNFGWYTPIPSCFLKDWSFKVGEWLANQQIAAGCEETKFVSREWTTMMSNAIVQWVEEVLLSYKDSFWCGSRQPHHLTV